MEEIKEILDKLNNRISNLEFKVANSELKEAKDTASDEWKPNIFVGYYYVDLDSMGVCDDSWGNTGTDNARLNHKVIFKTEEKAEEYLEYLEEKEKHINTFTEKEWENIDVEKWYYYYDCKAKTIISCAFKRYAKENMPYFKTEEEVKDFIQKYEWQIKHELGIK